MRTKVMLLLLSLMTFPALAVAQEEPEYATGWVTELAVKTALLEKAGGAALPITVTMDGTKAILTGDVESRVIQELAKEVALSIEGVASVDNRLKVDPASKGGPGEKTGRHLDQEVADAKLESTVKLKLFVELGRRARHLEVEAVDGVVSVRGTLPDAARKTIALETAGKVKDVVRVVDLIKIG